MLTSIGNNKNRIVYLCPRTNYLKVYSPVIVEQLTNGFPLEPIMIVPASKHTFWGNKNDTAATIDKLGSYNVLNQISIIEMNDEKHLLELLYEHNVKVVVEFSAYTNKEIYSYVLPESKKRGVKWCVIGSNGDELRVVDIDGGKTIEQWDLITVVNDFWRRWVTEYLEKINPQKAKYAEKAVPTGNPVFDQIPQLKFDRREILRKYNIPADKKIVFLTSAADYSISPIYTMPFFNAFVSKATRFPLLKQLFKKYMCGRPNALIKNWDRLRNYNEILAIIRDFADRNNCIIVLKRRNKDKKLKRCEKKYADMIFKEGSFYPFLTLELLSVSDIYIGFESYCLFEAIASGKPAITLISSLRMASDNIGLNEKLWNKLWLAEDAILKIKNVSDIYKTYINQDWKEFRKRMEGSLTEQEQRYDNTHREMFLKTFWGSSEFNASRRFLNAVEEIV